MPLTVDQTTTLALTLKTLVQRVDYESDENVQLNVILQCCQANLTALNSFHETEENESTDEVNKQLNRLHSRAFYAFNGDIYLKSQVSDIIISNRTKCGLLLSKHNELIHELAQMILKSCKQAYIQDPKNQTWANYLGIFEQFVPIGLRFSVNHACGQLTYGISIQDNTELEENYNVLMSSMNDYALLRDSHIGASQEMNDFTNFKEQFERILENPIYSKASRSLREKLCKISAYIEAKTIAVATPVAHHDTDELLPTASASVI